MAPPPLQPATPKADAPFSGGLPGAKGLESWGWCHKINAAGRKKKKEKKLMLKRRSKCGVLHMKSLEMQKIMAGLEALMP